MNDFWDGAHFYGLFLRLRIPSVLNGETVGYAHNSWETGWICDSTRPTPILKCQPNLIIPHSKNIPPCDITCKGFERPNAQSKACRQVAIVPSSIPANFAVLVPAEQLVQKKLLIFHKWSYSEWLIDCLLDFACLLAGLLAWLIVVRSKSWLRLMFLFSKQLTMGSWGVVPDTTAEAPSFWSHFLSTQSKSEKSTHTIQLYIISVSIPYKPYTRQCFKQLLRF